MGLSQIPRISFSIISTIAITLVSCSSKVPGRPEISVVDPVLLAGTWILSQTIPTVNGKPQNPKQVNDDGDIIIDENNSVSSVIKFEGNHYKWMATIQPDPVEGKFTVEGRNVHIDTEKGRHTLDVTEVTAEKMVLSQYNTYTRINNEMYDKLASRIEKINQKKKEQHSHSASLGWTAHDKDEKEILKSSSEAIQGAVGCSVNKDSANGFGFLFQGFTWIEGSEKKVGADLKLQLKKGFWPEGNDISFDTSKFVFKGHEDAGQFSISIKKEDSNSSWALAKSEQSVCTFTATKNQYSISGTLSCEGLVAQDNNNNSESPKIHSIKANLTCTLADED